MCLFYNLRCKSKGSSSSNYLSPKILRQNYLLSTSLERLIVLVELGLLIGGGVLIPVEKKGG